MRFNTSLRDRLRFYHLYLQDVVPHGVTVHRIPSNVPTRQALELRTYTGKTFVYGLVSMEEHYPDEIEEVAAEEAYAKYLDGYFARDDGTWRFFTGLNHLRNYCCFGGQQWELMGADHPIRDVREVAAYYQRQYDSMRHR